MAEDPRSLPLTEPLLISGMADQSAPRLGGGARTWSRTLAVLRQAFVMIVALVVIVQFVMSSRAHLANPYYFLASVHSYQLVGPKLGLAIAVITPFLQILVAAALLLRIQMRSAFACAAAIYLMFSGAQAWAVFNKIHISCGCFGAAQSEPVSYASLVVVGALATCNVIAFAITPVTSLE